jgi:membrane protease YdiL (CAAX protease family)
MKSNASTLPATDAQRTAVAFFLPLLLLILVPVFVGQPADGLAGQRALTAVALTAAAVPSLFLGLQFYGLKGLALRGHRALYAGIGFASLGWVAFLLVRLATVRLEGFGSGQTGATFLYLLLFEAFAVQLWLFGLLFRALADWRGALTAVFVTGFLFGLVAFFLFEESFLQQPSSLIYFAVWGIFYALIRLRTGSIIGIVLIQAMQSLTAWDVLLPELPWEVAWLNSLYLLSSLFYLIFIWRLWPQSAEDYRV